MLANPGILSNILVLLIWLVLFKCEVCSHARASGRGVEFRDGNSRTTEICCVFCSLVTLSKIAMLFSRGFPG
jgi:hypothetical protein